jgi:hypothetical protein
MLNANLRGRWGRKKRWDYWAVITDELVVSCVNAHIDYAGLANVWVMEHATGAQTTAGMLAPFGRGIELPAQVCTGVQSVAHKALQLRIEETPTPPGWWPRRRRARARSPGPSTSTCGWPSRPGTSR